MAVERGGQARARTGVPVGLHGDASFDTPNCGVCLHRMDAEETATGVPFWACAVCGATRVA